MTGFLLNTERTLTAVPFGLVACLSSPQVAAARHLTILEAHLEPGSGHSFHFHADQEEVIYVLSGRIEQWIGAQCRILGPGDAVTLARGTVHASFNVGSERAQVLAILGPCIGESGYACVDVFDRAPWDALREASHAQT